MPLTRTRQFFLLVLVAAAILSCVGTPFPETIGLHHVATTIGVLILLWVNRQYVLTDRSYVCLIMFLLLHVLGARYIYSYVPYDEWARSLCGVSPQELFGFRRNHYDRFVHFAFGWLLARPIMEILKTMVVLNVRQLTIAILLVISGVSFIYEILEWGIAIVFAPEFAESFNGQQGDSWDAYKDMALAVLGSLFGAKTLGSDGAKVEVNPAV